MDDGRPLAFVIMPFDSSFDDVWQQLIRAPLESIGFAVRRADSLFDQQNILRTIVRGIAEADLIVADVTGHNGNVLYELGIAHALGKRCVMITQQLEQLPFDLRPYRANEYSTNFANAAKLSDLLKDVGRAVLSGTAEFGTPVLDFAPEMVQSSAQVRLVKGQRPQVESTPTEDGSGRAETHGSGPGSPAESDALPLGALELVVELANESTELAAATDEITTATKELGEKITDHTSRVKEIRGRFGDQAAGALLIQANDAARDYHAYADLMEVARERIGASLNRFVELADQAARNTRIEKEEEAISAEESAYQLDTFAETLKESYGSTLGFAETLLDSPHVSRDLTRATKRTAKEVTETAGIIHGAQAEVSRVANLLKQRVEAYRDEEVVVDQVQQ